MVTAGLRGHDLYDFLMIYIFKMRLLHHYFKFLKLCQSQFEEHFNILNCVRGSCGLKSCFSCINTCVIDMCPFISVAFLVSA